MARNPEIRRGSSSARSALKRVLAATLVVLMVAAGSSGWAAAADPDETPTGEPETIELVVFWGEGCPHCAAERSFLDRLGADHPDLVVREYEVFHDDENLALFRAMARDAGIDARAVPTTFLGDRVWVGFDATTAVAIEEAVTALAEGRRPSVEEDRTVDVPFIGPVDVGGRSLIVTTLIIGFVDGINPCSLWVLSMLLAVVLHSGSRGRVLVVGAVFLVVTSAMYGLYVAGAYSALTYAGYLPWIRRAVAAVAAALGVLQLRDAAGVRGGPSLGVSDEAKPGLFRRMRALAAPERPLPAVLGATSVLAVGVSLLETPCTLGLPILWTDILAEHDVPGTGAVALFVVYLAAFLVDELVLFTAAVVTMRAVKLQERHGRDLKVVSGVVMLTLAGALVTVPAAMETVTGALAVFGVAALLAVGGVAAVHATANRRGERPGPVT